MTTMSEGSSPTSSLSSKTTNNGVNDQDVDFEKNSSLLNRPKRLIHYKKPDFHAEYAKHFGNGLAGDDDEDDDESFVLSSSDDSNHDNSNSNSSDASNASTSDNESTDKKQDTNEQINGNLNDSTGTKIKKQITQEVSRTTTGEKNEEKIQNPKKKRKRKTKKLKVKNEDSDMDTRKILESFKNAQIVKKPRQKKSTLSNKPNNSSKNPHKSLKTESVQPADVSKPYSGPYVKLIQQKHSALPIGFGTMSTNSCESGNFMDYSEYVVKSAASDKDMTTAMNIGVQSGTLDKSYKHLVPRDRPATMKNPSLVARCALCENFANIVPGLGDLFGPYRVSSDLDFDMIDDQSIDSKQDLDKDFKEVWLHEGCAVWSPHIYTKNNRLLGIASALKTASDLKCVFCKKLGASLNCRNVECTRTYHYPCAIKNECSFNEENFSILCKAHSKRTA